MRSYDERTTSKCSTFSELLTYLGWDNDGYTISGKFLDGIMGLVDGNHTLPKIFLKQDIDGKLYVLGDRSNNILYTLNTLLGSHSSSTVHRRKISGCMLDVVIIEFALGQDNVIGYYMDMGCL